MSRDIIYFFDFDWNEACAAGGICGRIARMDIVESKGVPCPAGKSLLRITSQTQIGRRAFRKKRGNVRLEFRDSLRVCAKNFAKNSDWSLEISRFGQCVNGALRVVARGWRVSRMDRGWVRWVVRFWRRFEGIFALWGTVLPARSQVGTKRWFFYCISPAIRAYFA
jgi:hypothetical protein